MNWQSRQPFKGMQAANCFMEFNRVVFYSYSLIVCSYITSQLVKVFLSVHGHKIFPNIFEGIKLLYEWNRVNLRG